MTRLSLRIALLVLCPVMAGCSVSPERQTVKSAEALVRRVLPEDAGSFEVECIEADGAGDVFLQ